MKHAYWTAAAIAGTSALVVAAFFLSGASGPIWPSLVGGVGVAGAFLLGLGAYALWTSRSATEAALAVGTLALFAGLATWVGFQSHERSAWKRSLLTETIRTGVDQGQADRHLTIPLLKTLQARRERPGVALRKHFLQISGDRLQQGGGSLPDSARARFVPEGIGDSELDLYYHKTGKEDRVVLVGCSGHGNGRDPEFTGYDGSKGNLQYKAVLTPNGLRYDREN